MRSEHEHVVLNQQSTPEATPGTFATGALPQPPDCSLLAPRFSPLPSRYSNPFATCWTRPGAIPFHWKTGQSAAEFISQLEQQSWRGAIIGPHGSGKSTLLATLIPELQSVGVTIYAITLQNGQRRLPPGFLPATPDKRSLLVIDGYEQLSWLQRYRLNRYCRRTGCGLLVTSHTPLRLPTLIELQPDAELLQLLVAELAVRIPTSVTSADVSSSQKRYGANVREIFFDLYDRHEQSHGNANEEHASCVEAVSKPMMASRRACSGGINPPAR